MSSSNGKRKNKFNFQTRNQRKYVRLRTDIEALSSSLNTLRLKIESLKNKGDSRKPKETRTLRDLIKKHNRKVHKLEELRQEYVRCSHIEQARNMFELQPDGTAVVLPLYSPVDPTGQTEKVMVGLEEPIVWFIERLPLVDKKIESEEAKVKNFFSNLSIELDTEDPGPALSELRSEVEKYIVELEDRRKLDILTQFRVETRINENHSLAVFMKPLKEKVINDGGQDQVDNDDDAGSRPRVGPDTGCSSSDAGV